MILKRTNQLYINLSLVFAIAVFPMSSLFQDMAYWGDGLFWYWIGVSVTYIIWLIGVALLVLTFTKKRELHSLLVSSFLGVFSCILLITGFLWTTFILLAGISGI